MSNKNPFFSLKKFMDRREFLQLFGLSAFGLLLPNRFLKSENPSDLVFSDLFGRVTMNGHKLYAEPDLAAEVLEIMAMDDIHRITGATIGGDVTMPNRIWYELDGTGFAHSGRVQPVRKQLNPVDTIIPEDGCLGEVTMPSVNAYSSLKSDRQILYKFYYAATFWILDRIVDSQDTVWYELLDDRYYRVFYVPAYYVRLVPDSELTALSPDVRSDDKMIIVDLATQMLTAYEGDKVAFMSRISSGVRLSEGGFATPKGYYRTTRKRPCRHMANPANAYGSGFDLPGVPWVSYFTSNGVALHGAYWHNNFGVPSSHGCVNMTPQAAKWIYRWTMPTVPPENYYYSADSGTRVIVQ
jgi:hypothetical protein